MPWPNFGFVQCPCKSTNARLFRITSTFYGRMTQSSNVEAWKRQEWKSRKTPSCRYSTLFCVSLLRWQDLPPRYVNGALSRFSQLFFEEYLELQRFLLECSVDGMPSAPRSLLCISGSSVDGRRLDWKRAKILLGPRPTIHTPEERFKTSTLEIN